ncbi:PREDICTED: uncharacterized protein LOC109155301 isoform X2 [Ipomoea nil]|uniref:uncharacterized protein LOC109155301 isoform X2 n=1 Tax=Ipomoea nil TaxID=35883 RepID=UPI000900B9D0|nr:PREDICTED: uncharacterized protein LOC109155301 isoform X2 [Ipomoea nil]
MKTATVSCFFILIFAHHQLLSGSALELTHAVKDTSLDISRDSNMGQERINGSRSSVDSKTDDIGEDFESMKLGKAQKGKGVYGGANVVHHPPGTRNLGSPTLISSFVNMKSDDNGEDSKSRHAMVVRKSQGHKGSSGGAPNIVHRPPDTKNLGHPTLIISTTYVVCFSFILLLVLVA